MDIRIGIQHSNREISFESNDNPDDVSKTVTDAVNTGNGVIRFTDTKGKLYLVPVTALGYIEIGGETGRRVGFVA